MRTETVRVSTHRHGCCVLQRCLDHAPEDQRNPILQMVVHHAKKVRQPLSIPRPVGCARCLLPGVSPVLSPNGAWIETLLRRKMRCPT